MVSSTETILTQTPHSDDISQQPQRQQQEITLTRCPFLRLISNTPKGRGIFATHSIPRNTILETSPVLVLPLKENNQHIAHTVLYHYTYNWPSAPPIPDPTATDSKTIRSKPTQAVVLGLGSLFNHSRRDQNVSWTRDLENEMIVYRALRDIAANEELCISYGDHLTFVDVDGDGASKGDEDQESHESFLGRIEVDEDS